MSTAKHQHAEEERDGPDPYDLHEQMFTAAETSNVTILQSLLDQWKRRNLDAEIIDGCLYGAVKASKPASVSLLLDYGATIDPDIVSIAVQEAVSTEIWQDFLNHGWDINSKDELGQPVLINFLDNPPMLQFFLDHGASPNQRSTIGLSPVTFAAGYRSITTLRTLLADGGTLAGSNALHEAAANKSENRLEIMRFLVEEHGVDVNEMSNYGPRRVRNGQADGRPLHKAIYSGRREHVEWLLERGANPELRDSWKMDAERFAKEFGYTETYSWVVEWMERNGIAKSREAC